MLCGCGAPLIDLDLMTNRSPFPKGSVCKPCWELKYCPYGPLVDLFPHAHPAGDPDHLADDERFKEVVAEIDGLNKITPDVVHDYSRLLSLLDPDNRKFAKEHYFEVGCRATGHACPVFFVQSGATETKESRAEGRSIPRQVMLKVVRRDNHVCQSCHTYVPDDQVEFDHIIPFSRGGPTTVENIRLLCRTCNRKKSNSLSELLSK